MGLIELFFTIAYSIISLTIKSLILMIKGLINILKSFWFKCKKKSVVPRIIIKKELLNKKNDKDEINGFRRVER